MGSQVAPINVEGPGLIAHAQLDSPRFLMFPQGRVCKLKVIYYVIL